ncbi:MAG TPA: CheR family methyltransferase [Bryobacteraceae bacterium]|nr:CheR family methyltransferase [Bryobacteraceae bacterium]
MIECAPIATLVQEAIGYDPASTGAGTFGSTVRAQMQCNGQCGPCAERLQSSPERLQALLDALVVPETWFFRDRQTFALLAALARERHTHPIRILSAACATGEEPYSIAMTLLDAGIAPERFEVDAVDVSTRAIEAARRAVYGKSSFREGPPNAYFTVDEDGARLAAEVARLVRFLHGNLVDRTLLAGEEIYDFVFCRNVLIYLSAGARKVVFENLKRLLKRDGVLFTGPAELAAFVTEGFRPLPHAGAYACTRPAAPRAKPAARAARRPAPAELPKPSPAPSPPAWKRRLEDARRLADAGELERASALCDEVLAVEPLAADAHFLKGLVEEAQGRMRSAEEWFRKALYIDPDHYDALLHMSVLSGGNAEVYARRAHRLSEREGQHG